MSSSPELAPASAFQRFHRTLYVSGWANANVAAMWRLRGKLDVPALEDAIDELVRRHEALRTTIATTGGDIRQCVWPFAPTTVSTVRVRSARSLDEPLAADAIAAEFYAPFEVSLARPLHRVSLFRAREPDDHVLALVMDHGIADGASCALLREELPACFAATVGEAEALPAVTTQLRDYAAWERSCERRRHADYWASRMAPTGWVLSPAGQPRDPTPTIPLLTETVVAARDIKLLNAISVRQRTTLSTAVFAAVAVALSPWTEDALRIGVLCMNRFDSTFRNVVGPLVSVLPLRVPLDVGSTFADIVGQVRSEWLGALRHSIPLEVMFGLAGTEDLGSPQILDVVVNFFSYRDWQPRVIGQRSGAPLTFGRHPLRAPSRYRIPRHAADSFPGIHAIVEQGGSLRLVLTTDDEDFLPQRALEALTEHVREVFALLARAPDDAIRRALARRRPIPVVDDLLR